MQVISIAFMALTEAQRESLLCEHALIISLKFISRKSVSKHVQVWQDNLSGFVLRLLDAFKIYLQIKIW